MYPETHEHFSNFKQYKLSLLVINFQNSFILQGLRHVRPRFPIWPRSICKHKQQPISKSISCKMNEVKNVVVVLSGKGGVGKSTVATQLALELKFKGYKVGILDIDICGPSVPYLLKLEGKEIHSSSGGAWVPVFADAEKNLAVMSIGFLTPDRDTPIVWRGPKKTGMIRQFLNDVMWQGVDYLVIDTPPGTSDEHITLAEELRKIENLSYGAVVVTTPQNVAVDDVRRQITFCRKTGLNVLGIIENMSGYRCPSCSECSNIFSSGGGAALSELTQVPLFGRLPIDPALNEAGIQGMSLLEYASQSAASGALSEVVDRVTAVMAVASKGEKSN